uniref:WW domain-containing protein n=1 Tax=Alexandrium monilatum TaxID=311494 RepID=A0A7S4W6H0_9DINO
MAQGFNLESCSLLSGTLPLEARLLARATGGLAAAAMRTYVAVSLLFGSLFACAAEGIAGSVEGDGDAFALVQGLMVLSSEQMRSGQESEEAAEPSDSEGAAAASEAGPAPSAASLSSTSATGLSAEDASLKERVGSLEAAKLKAIEQEDYDLAKQLKREIGVLLGENSLERLRALKRAAVESEDFDAARDLKQRIRILENGSGSEPLADRVKAYFTVPREPLPWGWRSARDPGSGLEYYWPVNDRAAVTWDRPLAPAPGAAPPAQTAVQTTTPPPPFQVKSASTGSWSPCNLLGNGTKAGTYNISVRASGGVVSLTDVPGYVVRNATDNVTLLTKEEFIAIRKAAMPPKLQAKVGDQLEVKTRSHSWVPCVVTGVGNATDTYDIHVPRAPVGLQDHLNVSLELLRPAATGPARPEEQRAANAGGEPKRVGGAEAAPHSQTP